MNIVEAKKLLDDAVKNEPTTSIRWLVFLCNNLRKDW